MGGLTDEVNRESQWMMMFVDDTVMRAGSKWKKNWRGGVMCWKEEELKSVVARHNE